MTVTANWIALDWGTTNLRAWAIAADGTMVAEAASGAGMGTLTPEAYEPALLALVGGWLGTSATPVVACGMVGAKQGWVAAPYAAVPCRPLAAGTVRAATRDARLAVAVAGGLSQAHPADVMRGEEVQIAGFLSLNPQFDGVICLPGSHTKWAHVSAGEVVSFRTAMTGELFAALTGHTVLRHSIGDPAAASGASGAPVVDDGDAAFLAAVETALSRPETLAVALFSLRAEGLLGDLPPGAARARLSGTLIGAELAATRAYWLGRDVALIGVPDLCRLYEIVLRAQGVSPIRTRGDKMVLAGLTAVRRAEG